MITNLGGDRPPPPPPPIHRLRGGEFRLGGGGRLFGSRTGAAVISCPSI